MEAIRRSKLHLLEWLMADPDFILQAVQQDGLLTQRQYLKLKSESDPEKQIINLLDSVMGKGQHFCEKFISILQKDEVQDTYPNLRMWDSPRHPETPSVASSCGRSVIANVEAGGGSTVVCPVIQGSTGSISFSVNVDSGPSGNSRANKHMSLDSRVKELEDKVQDKQQFLKRNWANLVQKIKCVDDLADEMRGNRLNSEMYSLIMACNTPENKMRKLLEYTITTKTASEYLFTKLCRSQYYIMQDLIS
uniref:Uncharacterized LOC103176519 n=1 Tax=Callorhinchus milii TaxID=7868 RepID=A0A4W3JB32_CALMI|eukprot:gi/632945937/ref/XP_007888308.1/ PREDICTED: uncharacterized protein LOC103176519 isoform X1 [Callorhinchus milii]